MQIKLKSFKPVREVYAITIGLVTERYFSLEQQVVFYYTEPGLFGLSSEDLREVIIVDDQIGSDFRFHLRKDNCGITIMWDHFENTDHLVKLIDLDPDVVANFEKARELREKSLKEDS